MRTNNYDVIIIGAGAAGLMAAYQAAKRGRKTLLIEHTGKIGEKIRISGGGRCNFTNINASPKNYICQNPHFVKSALASYTAADFISLVESHKIAYHEKTLGQLFCNESSKQIIDMLQGLCHSHQVKILLNCHVTRITKNSHFNVESSLGIFEGQSLIIATGGLSIPKIGASDFGYRLAKKFGLNIITPRPALVPLLASDKEKEFCYSLRGISNSSVVRYPPVQFKENILFTHKGLSGPAVLQISSYLPAFHNEEITIDLSPGIDLKQQLLKNKDSKQIVINCLKTHLPNRLVEAVCLSLPEAYQKLAEVKKETLLRIADHFHNFKICVNGSEGYQKAEVTAGGIDTLELSSKTMECKKVSGLYFIGEVVDVTGWLGGYNFQWAWSSAVAAGGHC